MKKEDLIKIIREGFESSSMNEGDRDSKRYMFMSNLKQMCRQAELLMQEDSELIDSILDDGHDWAADHVATAKESLDQVFDFMMNEIKGKNNHSDDLEFEDDGNESEDEDEYELDGEDFEEEAEEEEENIDEVRGVGLGVNRAFGNRRYGEK
jgi:hypothetical protein